MKNILITGCNGLIGTTVVEELKTNSELNLFGIGRGKMVLQNTIKIDLSENWSDELLPEQMDVIIHLAQSEKFRDFPNSAVEVYNVNTTSTLKLLEYARKSGVKKFIYASSGGIYGNSNDEFNEDEQISMRNDLGFYLSTKFCSELLVQNYAAFFDIDILRFFFAYGKEQKEDMLIPRLIRSVKQGLPITLQGNDGLKLNPIYVQDAASAVIKCFGLKGSTRINIGGNEIHSLRALCEIIGEQVKKQPVFKIENIEPKHLIGDISKMKELLITPKISFEEGIKKMI